MLSGRLNVPVVNLGMIPSPADSGVVGRAGSPQGRVGSAPGDTSPPQLARPGWQAAVPARLPGSYGPRRRAGRRADVPAERPAGWRGARDQDGQNRVTGVTLVRTVP